MVVLVSLVTFISLSFLSTTDQDKNIKADATWHSYNWLYRNKITVDNTKVPNTDQADFPVLINSSNNDWRDTANGGYVE